jgi:hypothetical protein
MFSNFPFEEKLVDLENPELIFHVVENHNEGQILFGLQIASYRD